MSWETMKQLCSTIGEELEHSRLKKLGEIFNQRCIEHLR